MLSGWTFNEICNGFWNIVYCSYLPHVKVIDFRVTSSIGLVMVVAMMIKNNNNNRSCCVNIMSTGGRGGQSTRNQVVFLEKVFCDLQVKMGSCQSQ